MKKLLKSLTLDEKLMLLTGKDSWHTSTADEKVKSLSLCDGPHGLRMMTSESDTVPATAMPTLALLASTWDKELCYLDGATIADDCIENGADVLLAPGVNMKRTPLSGRNFEYFSEDPLIAGELASEFVKGLQEKGIGACLKHFAANNREYNRSGSTSEVDERTLHDIYLRAFEIVIKKAKPWSVMCSYNKINGVYCSENKRLLDGILRDQFGFDGPVMSDWGAVHNRYKSLKAGVDLQMPYTECAFSNLKEAFENGLITEGEIDKSVLRLLELAEKTENKLKKVTTKKEDRHAISRMIAENGMVLLKNEDNILPLGSCNIVVEGHQATVPTISGGGSALAFTTYVPKHLADCLAENLPDAKITSNRAYKLHGDYQQRYINSIRDAYNNDVVVVTIGNDHIKESESWDREDINLRWSEVKLIKDIAKVNKNIVVVLYASGPVDMRDFIDDAKAVLLAGFAGEGANEAVANILTGKVNPSGKLTETFPLSLEDTPTGMNVGDMFVDRYSEGVMIGYRYYDYYKKDVMFPFGHGISYSDIKYSDFEVKKLSETDYELSYTLTNDSDMNAKEVSQIYVSQVFKVVSRPEKELCAFSKNLVKAHSKTRVTLKLDKSAFEYYNPELMRKVVENGDYVLMLGASSRDIRAQEKITINLPDEDQHTLYILNAL